MQQTGANILLATPLEKETAHCLAIHRLAQWLDSDRFKHGKALSCLNCFVRHVGSCPLPWRNVFDANESQEIKQFL